MNIPLVDLKRQYETIKPEVDEAMQKVILETAFIKGKYVKQFEEKFAVYNDAKYCVGMSNGTSALWIALKALGIGPGDEVITVPNTFIATSEAITAAGAKIKFVDVHPDTYLMDETKLESIITKETKAIMPVHLYGQMANMQRIKEIADRHGLRVIEDAAQAHGAQHGGKLPGSYSDIATFSFYPGKNLGAYGDAGAVITNDEGLARKVRMLIDHGRDTGQKYEHSLEGYNERMDGLQGAVLDVKLKYLDMWNGARRIIAEQYNSLLAGIVKTPTELEGNKHVYHIYAIETEDRDALCKHLKEAGIEAGIHYPIPLHLLQAYKHLNLPKGSYPVTENVAGRILSLPIYPEMNNEQLTYVADKVKEFYHN
jgi:dTDP-4-amino-4,6-dideoxygalactose transaminase